MISTISKYFGAVAVILLAGCMNSTLINTYELSMPILAKFSGLESTVSAAGLPLINLRVGDGFLVAEVASTPEQHSTGLAFRHTLGADGAMLFAYPAPHKVVYYMKDTYIPLSVAYIDSMGVLLEIYDLMPGVEAPVISRSSAVRFVLEVNRGWFAQNGIVPGSRIYVEK